MKTLQKFSTNRDIFVFPSKVETYGIVVLEALSAGLYIICGENLKGTFDDLKERDFLEYCAYDTKSISEAINNGSKNIEKIRARAKKPVSMQWRNTIGA